ncbi:MAG: GNAT family N-acetyltransferase [Candidatus Izemoplasmatales bacterium]|jgi:GNAT superfamily N-acetyltransferase
MIRPGRQDDLDEIQILAQAVVQNLKDNHIDQWSRWYPNKADFAKDVSCGALFVAEISGKIVGTITVLPENEKYYHEVEWELQNAFVIHRVMVSPAYHRQGIGTALFNYAIAYAIHNHQKALKVDTHPDNFRMQNLIISLGFKYKGYLPSINRQAYELIF